MPPQKKLKQKRILNGESMRKKLKSKRLSNGEKSRKKIKPKRIVNGNDVIPKKKKMKIETVDEFLTGELNASSSDNESDILESVPKATEDEDEVSLSMGTVEESKQHKASLMKLKETDPEFFQFLEENDKELLNFDYSSNESDDEEKCHKPSTKLEVASDESDFDTDKSNDDDDDEEEGGSPVKHKKYRLSLEQIHNWKNTLLEESKPVSTVGEIINAFKSLVQQMTGEAGSLKPHEMDGGAAFNRLIQLCMVDLIPTFNKLLRISPEKISFNPSLSKMWGKMKPYMKCYLHNLNKILPEVASPNLMTVFLKHILQLIPYLLHFPAVLRACLKKLISIWSTGEESVRVLALLCIIRSAQKLPEDALQALFKTMYLAYVKNCKFTSPSTWPVINFMKHSLIEVLAINQSLAYQHSFVYIRQLAIHLRNAVTVKKKEAIKTVYNWQFIHCLYFWSQFLAKLHPSTILSPLIHPLTRIITGTINLIPTAKYIPLRFHCLRALIILSRDTNTYIPVLPFLIESLEIIDLSKKTNRISWKPLDFICAIKLSKSQLDENGFQDAVLDHFYEIIMDYLSVVSHCLGFPELILTTTLQMRNFVKTCKNAKYNKLIKQLVEKIAENSDMISERRKSVTFSIADTKAVENLENEIKQNGTPILQYYSLYRKMRDKEIAMTMSQKEELDDVELPTIKRKELLKAQKEKDKKEFSGLFEDSDDSDDETLFAKHEEND